MHPYASPLCIIMHLPCASLCISIVHPYASPLCVLIISLFHAHPLCIPTSSGPARSNRYSGWPGATCPAPTSSSCRSPSGGPRPAAATPMANPYCSCKLTRVSIRTACIIATSSHGLQLQPLWRIPTAAAARGGVASTHRSSRPTGQRVLPGAHQCRRRSCRPRRTRIPASRKSRTAAHAVGDKQQRSRHVVGLGTL